MSHMVPSIHMNPAWDPTVEDIADWTVSNKDLAFGHVEAPHTSGKSTFIPRAVWSAVTKRNHKTNVFHVAPESEIARLKCLAEGLDPASNWHQKQVTVATRQKPKALKSLGILCFSEAIDMIEKELQGSSNGSGMEEGSQNPTLFIVDLDLQCPTNQALALIAIMAWAKPAGHHASRSASVTVLTMAAWEPPSYLKKLYRTCDLDTDALPQIRVFHPELGQQLEPPLIPVDRERLASTVMEAIVPTLEGLGLKTKRPSHLILILNPMSGEYGFTGLKDVMTSPMSEPLGAHSPQILTSEEAQRLHLLRWNGLADITAVDVLQAGTWHFRGQVQGFDHVHIVIGEERRRAVFDRETAQIVNIVSLFSYEERYEILAWARRTTATNVTVYLADGEATDVDGYVEYAATHQRWDVANHEMLGFLASLSRFQPWLRSMSDVLESFIQPHDAAVMLRRGVDLGIFSYSGVDTPGSLSIRSTLPQEQQRLFGSLLHMCGYDARLALLLTLPNVSPFLTTVKVDLAALLSTLATTGPASLLTWLSEERPGISKDCLGLAYPLANSGSLWKMLALWQHRMCCISNSDTGSKILSTGVDLNNVLSDHVIRTELNYAMSASAALRAWRRRLQILEVFKAAAIEVESGLDFEHRLSSEDTSVLIQQICTAYIHNLCAAKVEMNGAAQYSDYVAGTELVRGAIAEDLFDWVALGKASVKRNGFLYGMHMFPLQRAPDHPYTALADWICIPSEAVVQWRMRRPQRTLRQLLKVDYQFRQNGDEQKDDEPLSAPDQGSE